MESTMYISESQSNGCSQQPHHQSPKFASTNSIPSLIESCPAAFDLPDSKKLSLSPNSVILRDQKTRRHSVLDDLKARRDSFFQKARRSSIFEDKENKEKRRSSDGNGRRGSIFYVSHDLLSEEAGSGTYNLNDSSNDNDDKNNTNTEDNNQEVSAQKDDESAPLEFSKKSRRKSWHPLAGKPPKVDRKRRKGVASSSSVASTGEVGSSEGLYNARQKRPSWWNIFVPDSVGRCVDISIRALFFGIWFGAMEGLYGVYVMGWTYRSFKWGMSFERRVV